MGSTSNPPFGSHWPLYEERFTRLVALWDHESPSDCDRNFRALLAATRETAEDDPAERTLHLALLLILNARAQCFFKRPLEASESLKEAERLFADIAEPPVSLRLLWLIERSRLSIAEKTPSQARIVLSEAWNLAISGGYERAAIDVTQMMALIEPQKTQLDWIKKGIEIAEKSTAPGTKHVLDSLYLAQGWKRYELRQFADAIEVFRKVTGQTERLLAEWAIGRTLRALNRSEEALTLQLELLGKYDRLGERNGDVYEEIAECLQLLKRPGEAEKYFDLAFREHTAHPPEQDRLPQDLKRLKTLGKSKP